MPLPSFRASLRVKLILCLLFTSLVSTAIMGGLAYRRLLDKFDDMTMHDSVARFSGDVAQYFRTYGTWENGMQQESFFSFTQRRRAVMLASRRGLQGPAQGIRPGEPGLPADEGPPGGPPPRGGYQGGFPGGSQSRDDYMRPLPPGEPRDVRDGLGGRDMRAARMGLPPFRFYLFDADHRSLVRMEPYGLGDEVRDEDRGRLRAVETGGRVVAYFSPQGEVNYSDLDLGYLAAMRESLVLGVTAGGVLTLVLGLLFGNQLSRSLRQLTRAAQAMGRGEWRQQVVVQSNDEVGVLATAFNRMSRDLADQYEELQASNERIEEMAGQLRELSMRDVLTGLYNRRFFDEQCTPLFQRARRHERPLSLVMADIDHFKRINDQFSHAIGDEVLRRVGHILNTTLRTTDLVARYGGEEFAIALPETDASQAVEACEALRQRIESHPWADVYPGLEVTMSLGIASDTDVADFHAMLAGADRCLYQAKDGGRNRVAGGACSEVPAN